MRACISALPDGVYRFEDYLETYMGGNFEPLLLPLALTVAGDRMTADFTGANLSRTVLEFAVMNNVNLQDANLYGAELGGANLTGANLAGADLAQADVTSAVLQKLKGRDKAVNFDKVRNLKRAFLD